MLQASVIGPPAEARALAALLAEQNRPAEAHSPADFLATMQWQGCRLLLVVDTPSFDASEFCRRIRAAPHLRPSSILAVVPRDTPARARALIAAGATDFLLWPAERDALAARLDVLQRREAEHNEPVPSGRTPLPRTHLLYPPLQQGEARYREAVQAASEGMAMFDDRGQVLFVNAALTRMLGRGDELLGEPFLSLLPEAERPRVAALLEQLAVQGTEISWHLDALPFLHASREELSLETSLRLASREEGVFTATLRDLAIRRREEEERAELQAAIRRAAEEWRLTFDSVSSPIMVLDPQLRIARLNRAARDLTGRDYRELVGQTVRDLGPGQPWEQGAALVQEVLRTRAQRSSEVRDPDSNKMWDISATLLPGIGPMGEQVIVVASDITHVVDLQDSLRKSETMSVMGRLVGNVAHEARNPLFAISATLDAFEGRFGEREEHSKYMNILRVELGRLNRLMSELLEYGKPQVQPLTTGSVSAVVADAAASCARVAEETGVQIDNRVNGELPPVRMDPLRLVQVFQNVIQNAVQHSPPGERVEVDARLRRGPEGGSVECVVRDRGPGIRSEDLGRVFEPFFSRRSGGIGLGLSIVQRIVEEHRGTIRIDNRPEGGATVTVQLPCPQLE